MDDGIPPIWEDLTATCRDRISQLPRNIEGHAVAIETANRDLASVLRRYGFFGLDVGNGGKPITARFGVVHASLEPIPASPPATLVIIADRPDIDSLPGLGVQAEPAGGLLYDRPAGGRRGGARYRALLPAVSFSGAAVTPIWMTESGRAVVGWWERYGRRDLVIGLNVVEEIVRYTQGDPNKVATVADKTMWGSADHERPAYLFEDNIAAGHEMTPWADRLGYLLARLIAEACAMPLIATLPGGARGGVLLTGDDDEAYLEKYDEQLKLLDGFPITYFLLPRTRHSPDTLAHLPKSVELGVHVDALSDPAAYETICCAETEAVRRLTGRPVRSVRNHGHLNRGYWGLLPAWEKCDLAFDLNIRGIDGTCPTGSYLPYCVRRRDGMWSTHRALFSTFSDTMLHMQNWPPAQQVATIRALADRIDDEGPGVIVANFHPQNVSESYETHQAVMAIGRREGWVALGVESYCEWLAMVDGISMVETTRGFELHSPSRIERLAYSWPDVSGLRVLPPWEGVVSLLPMPSSKAAEQGLSDRRAQKRLRSRRIPEEHLVDVLRRLPEQLRDVVLPTAMQKREGWHSWDPTPWAHPWLSPVNLAAARAFNDATLAHIIERYGGEPSRTHRYAFVGNLANNMAMRALPLRRRGSPIDLFLHPFDRFVMSQPGWELSDIELPEEETDVDRLRAKGICLPDVADCFTPRVDGADETARIRELAVRTPARDWAMVMRSHFLRHSDTLVWPDYMAFVGFCNELQDFDCIFAAQSPYLAYLANKPYLAAQTGGDLWLEASRQDALGTLQRRAYGWASAILATNPWAYSSARRYGFRHVLYVPLIIDIDAYAPGPTAVREKWQREVGGNFFALVTARIDRYWKGSHIGMEGFVRFAERFPQARLVLVGWGESSASDVEELRRRGLDGRFIRLPISGKRKLVDYLRAADCLIDQFVIGYYGATALEAMATGTPVIMHLLCEQYEALCPTGAPPVLIAATPDEVSRQLERLASSPTERHSLSAGSRRWIERNHSADVWGDAYNGLLRAVASGERLRFERSPLAAPLTRGEKEYHRAGLAAAPLFPQYRI
jgi:glycosyltransferase involved in cell wall biosynthesis